MAHVTALAQHILNLQPDKDAARLSLYHYLKNLCEATEPVNSELMNRFFCRALTFAHWQQEKSHLFHETAAVLQHFQDTQGVLLPLNEMFRADDVQVVPIESIRNLDLVINRYLERSASPYDQYRTINEGEDRINAIILQGDRSLRVTVFPKVLAIREGELLPLTLDYTLFYSPELQLHPMMIHQVEVGPHTSARFQMRPDGIHGTIVRGYTFQRYATMDGGGLHRYPVLFYPLKRLEQFFVNRKSDPMYVELTNLLEKALELTSAAHPEALKFAEAALERGKLALEHIFPDDKLVRLLINNLEKTLALELARQGLQLREPRPQAGPLSASSSFESGFDSEEDLGVDLVAGPDADKDEPWPQIKNLPV